MRPVKLGVNMIPRRCFVISVNFLFALVWVSSVFGAMAKTTNLRVGLPGRLSSNWPLYVAAERGFFTQEGLNVELIAMRNATIQVQALIAGDLQANHNSVRFNGSSVLRRSASKIYRLGAAKTKLSVTGRQRDQ